MTNTILDVSEINTYYDSSHVLKDVSLEVPENEVTALLGRNGAGKTTTLRSIMGIQPPRSGRIRFRGQDLTSEETFEIANRQIGYVPEGRRVWDTLTVEENIVIGMLKSDSNQAKKLDYIYDLFPELAEIRDREATKLSGGEKQMLSIARALVGDTECLLLDEPSEGLAPKIIERVYDVIREIQGENTILLVEQNFEFAAALAERYYILDKGEIVHSGEIDALTDDDELKERYLGVT
jgi:branched-chain amino acid transport system ATP-binding protein